MNNLRTMMMSMGTILEKAYILICTVEGCPHTDPSCWQEVEA